MPVDYGTLDRGRGISYWEYDPVLRREVRRVLPDDDVEWATRRLSGFGETVGTTIADNADVVDDNPPELRTYDRDGGVVNEVEYHPAHVENERLTYEAGGVADAFRAPPDREEPVALTYNLAVGYLLGMVDIGLACPFAMTAGAALVLDEFSDREAYVRALTAREYDDLLTGAMFLTERQGGSDVGATETVAEHVDEDVYRLEGEKWFTSNIDAGVVLALARRPDAPDGTDGLSLFVVPRTKRDGDPNDYYFRRLKDKLGTKSVPTGEVELRGAEGYLVGEPERGFRYMAEMLNVERLHNAVGSVGVMSRALLESKIRTATREAFGETLDEKPLMRRDLVDMAVDQEAAAAFTFDAVRAFDRYHRGDERSGGGDVAERGSDGADPGAVDGVDPEEAYRLMRMLVPIAKHRTGRMAVEAASYAIEIQGGNGYTGEWVTERLLRDAQVLPVWEGTSNVLSLDVLRAMAREGAHVATLDRIRAYLEEASADDSLAGDVRAVQEELAGLEDALATLGTADRDYAELNAKALADYVFDVYAGALLLAEAARSLVDEDDARLATVARRWVDRRLRDRDARGITSDDRLPLEQFDAVVRFAAVDPASLADARSRGD